MPERDAPQSQGTPVPPAAPEAPAPAAAPEQKIHMLDARSLRGLAHPLRMSLLRALRDYGPATASQLADRLGESSGATSYHLRQLATYGFVEDAPEHGKGRERWWRAAHDGTYTDGSLADNPDPAVRGAVDLLVHEIANSHTRELATWLGTSRDWPDEWRLNTQLSDYTVRLTPQQAAELGHRMTALIESYRLPGDEGVEGSAKYRVHVHGFPITKD
ncbi:ArsR/SmtB family transcription factor [Streptomyces sp. NPDC051561]|uniref:ArsR/SmtB family transcription factor n=1 Tax=Streptomyces sp. NPDC051561 TaxID=3365658 RepID=UPI0037B04879